jgi:hypothetical protein
MMAQRLMAMAAISPQPSQRNEAHGDVCYDNDTELAVISREHIGWRNA